MKIYVASSWRNTMQPHVVDDLRNAGYDVYDFKNPTPGNTGFSWRECATEEQLKDGKRFRDEVLTTEVACRGFSYDMNALKAADATVLILPCGRSAHLELGFAVGRNQRTLVLLDKPLEEPELMYLMVDKICVSMAEVLRYLEIYGMSKMPDGGWEGSTFP